MRLFVRAVLQAGRIRPSGRGRLQSADHRETWRDTVTCEVDIAVLVAAMSGGVHVAAGAFNCLYSVRLCEGQIWKRNAAAAAAAIMAAAFTVVDTADEHGQYPANQE